MIPPPIARSLLLPRLSRYAAAALLSVAAAGLTWLLWPIMRESPFVLFFAVIVLSTAYGGIGPGLLTTGAAVLTVGFVFLAPPDAADAVRLAVFTFVALLIGSITLRLRAEEEHATHASAAAAAAAVQATRLRSVGAALTGALTAEQVAQVVLREGLPALGADSGAVFTLEPGGQTLVALARRGCEAADELPMRVEVDHGGPLAAVLQGDGVVIAETPGEIAARWPQIAATQLHANAAVMAVALRSDSRLLGVLCVAYHRPHACATAERSCLATLADQCAQALDRSRLYEAERAARTAAELAAARNAQLQAITAALAEALTPHQVAQVILREGTSALNARAGTVVLLHDDSSLELVGAVGHPPGQFERWQRFSLTMPTPVADAVRDGAPVLIGSREERDLRYPELAAEATDNQSWAAIPLQIEGRSLGALGLSFPTRRSFSADDLALMLTLARQCGQSIERARLYEAERTARAAAEAAVRLRDQFLSVASHELKTPLTSLLGNAQLLARRATRDTHFPERDLRAVRVVAEQAERLNRLIDAMLDLSRLQSGRLGVERYTLDLGALARRVVADSRVTLDQHQIICDGDQEELLVKGDALRLEQVIQNLLQNAVKYSPNGGLVRLRAVRDGDEAVLVVSDEGIGIPAAALPHLFTRFYRASNAVEQQISGFGIGLYVVREIVDLHGGSVSVESHEGVGSTFTVRLPLVGTQAALPVAPLLG